MQQRYLGLINEFRCMQCQNEALADSNVGLAADLRREIHDLILAGKSDDQIRDYLVARYGEFILFRPRMSLRNLWLWSAPAVLLLAGLWDRRARDAAARATADHGRRSSRHSDRHMTTFILWAAACALVAVLLVAWPLLRNRRSAAAPQYALADRRQCADRSGRRIAVPALEQLAVAHAPGCRPRKHRRIARSDQ